MPIAGIAGMKNVTLTSAPVMGALRGIRYFHPENVGALAGWIGV